MELREKQIEWELMSLGSQGDSDETLLDETISSSCFPAFLIQIKKMRILTDEESINLSIPAPLPLSSPDKSASPFVPARSFRGR